MFTESILLSNGLVERIGKGIISRSSRIVHPDETKARAMFQIQDAKEVPGPHQRSASFNLDGSKVAALCGTLFG